MNLSKHGVGFSAGVRGLRVGSGPRGGYVHAGRNGLYYRAGTGKRRRRASANGNGGSDGHPILLFLFFLVLLVAAVIHYWKILLSLASIIAAVWLIARIVQSRKLRLHKAPLADSTSLHIDDESARHRFTDDPASLYSEYPPKLTFPDLDGAIEKPPPPATTKPANPESKPNAKQPRAWNDPELVSRAGKPKLWREHPERDEVMIQLSIQPIAPDPRWWACFSQVLMERNIKVKFGEVAQGGVATSAENPAAVAEVIAAIDAAIDTANLRFLDTVEADQKKMSKRRIEAARLRDAQAKLDTLANRIEEPDST